MKKEKINESKNISEEFEKAMKDFTDEIMKKMIPALKK